MQTPKHRPRSQELVLTETNIYWSQVLTSFSVYAICLQFQFLDGALGILLEWDPIYENNEKAVQAWITPFSPSVVLYHPDTIKAVFNTAGTWLFSYQNFTVGLSTRALKPDSLDPDPRFGYNVISRHADYAMHCWTGSHALFRSTVTQNSAQLGSGSRPCGGKVVFRSGSPFRIRSGSKVPCGEPH